MYEGGFINGQFHGKGKGFHPHTSLVQYSGDFKNGEFHGMGELWALLPRKKEDTERKSGIYYKGGFVNNRKEGIGKTFYPSGAKKYSGEFKNDKWHGKGRTYWQNGLIEHSGGFLNDLKHGFGRSYYSTGDQRTTKFEGEFKSGLPSGHGTVYFRNKAVYYSGDFLDGTPRGKSGLYWENGNFNMVFG